MAAPSLNLPLLTWLAEDRHWRGRTLPSRPWPRLGPTLALAWADWRRLGRRPALLIVLAATTPVPVLAATATSSRGPAAAVALLAGGIAAGTQGVTATRRDTNDRTLRRLFSLKPRTVLAARALLPAALSGGWLALALTLLSLAGVLSGGLWPLLGLAAGPGLAASALQLARTGAIDPGEQGPASPLGTAPRWLVTRALSVVAGLAGSYPMFLTVQAGQNGFGLLAAQIIVSGLVLGLYLLLATRPGRR